MLDSVRYKVFGERHRYYLIAVMAAILGLTLVLIAPYMFGLGTVQKKTPIKVGVLHSLSGTMALSERSVAEASLLAVEELNRRGGVLGRKVEAILLDGRSNWDVFANQAENLIRNHQVSAVFGCWTSACRKTVKPVFERLDHVLFYPVQYEGLEQSPNIIYTGAAPNQQIIPATKWTIDNIGKRIYLVGSDYVFPRTAHEIIQTQVSALNAQIVGESYIPLGGTAFEGIIDDIKEKQPDIIFNTINGDSNLAFYKQLREQGVRTDDIPVMSFSLAESEVQVIGPDLVAGDYAARNYFQTIQSEKNKEFVTKYRARFGQDKVTTAPMEAAYFGVFMWAQAVAESGSIQYRGFRDALLGQTLNAPSGIVYIDPNTQHTWRTVLIGQVRTDGNFDLIWDSGRPVRPVPYPGFFAKAKWEEFLSNLFEGWGGQWEAEGRT
ncbi:urea ABC transporter substrate-binding protein [Terasakiella sp. A23]|uniref:urea ABC transporter substrate-binding protein n=1 Tax=Terasakiella sp. FCG-A23 TaxID=3080561 RepID=UPI002955C89E|nr:urea ABC transporter substrate-binding protein [Terasakiella sp. A23]MDV7339572.1 urea ABC transporter substrate-binding protein [Terasakiella sp. A23]